MPIAVSLCTFFVTLAGGLTAGRVTDRRHLVLGLAGGLTLGVVGLDLLPEALEAMGGELHCVPVPLLLFVAGFLLAHAARHLTGQRRDRRVGLVTVAGLVGHSFLDGVAIGAAFQVGGGMGVAVAIAVIAHDFADGFNTYTLAELYGNSRRRALSTLGADALAPVAGAASTLLIAIPQPLLAGYFSLFGGVLLYLAASEILPEAHHDHPAVPTLLCTVGGTAFIWLVVGYAG
ncbi:ZIP family metal transporter [Streptomyces fractus]|uniref:ZIP family metal transporter n=1 Tax=Streptomyces fractus TaxID=641806 RepID=UPI003CF5A647